MSYFYPEALNAMEKIARDLFAAAYPDVMWSVRVVADSRSGTASVDWHGDPRRDACVRVTINMPVRPVTYRMTADEFRRWAAYLLHEVGHPNETCKKTWDEAVRTNRNRMLNYLEDVREEKASIERGIAANARQVLSDLIDSLHARNVAEGYDPNEPASIGWTLAVLGRANNGYNIDISDITKRMDPNGIVGKIVVWALPDLDACQSTQDCLDLSDRVIAAVRDAKRAEKAEEDFDLDLPIIDNAAPAPAEPQGGWSEDRGDTTDIAEPADGGADEATDEEIEEAMEEIAEDYAGSSQGGAQEPQPEKEFDDSDIEEMDMTPNDRDDIASSGQDYFTHQWLGNIIRNTVTKPDSAGDNPIRGRNLHGSVDMVTGNASRMGRQRALLARALKAEDMDHYEGNRAHGRLNRHSLPKIAAGQTYVFGKRVLTEGYDTDVQILVDGSGSMSGGRIIAASTLALVVAQAAAQVGVDCTCHVFNDNGLHYATKGRSKPAPRKFAYMYNQIMGGTPLTENLLLAAQIQAHRAKGKRKVLFVITDGGCSLGPDVVKAAGEYVERVHGTEIANLHIGSQPMGLFRNETAVNVRKVEETGLKQLTALLERGL